MDLDLGDLDLDLDLELVANLGLDLILEDLGLDLSLIGSRSWQPRLDLDLESLAFFWICASMSVRRFRPWGCIECHLTQSILSS